METKEFKIQVPEGYEIDKENSTFECIKFKKKKTISYSDISYKLIEDFGGISYSSSKHRDKIFAINKLLFVAKYLNGGWVPNFNNSEQAKYFITVDRYGILQVNDVYSIFSSLVYFKTKELAYQAIEILGKETIKQALNVNY